MAISKKSHHTIMTAAGDTISGKMNLAGYNLHCTATGGTVTLRSEGANFSAHTLAANETINIHFPRGYVVEDFELEAISAGTFVLYVYNM